MSPFKRAFAALYGEGSSPKRIRGGGDGEDYDDPELYDDDLLMNDAANTQEEDIPDELLQQVVQDVPETAQQRWKRPDISADFSSDTDDLNLQWIDMDVVLGAPLMENPNSSREVVVGSSEAGGQVPILRCYGVDEQGHSVAVFIHGSTQYAYFALPADCNSTFTGSESDLFDIRTRIDSQLKSAGRGCSQMAVLLVEFVETHKSIYGYDTPHTKFLKIYVSLPNLIAPLKRIMEEGILLPPVMYEVASYSPFECNVPFVLRFMVDQDITGAGWLSLLKNTYKVRAVGEKETHCQVYQ
jgi:DNA polymerase family B, exonuclease domain